MKSCDELSADDLQANYITNPNLPEHYKTRIATPKRVITPNLGRRKFGGNYGRVKNGRVSN